MQSSFCSEAKGQKHLQSSFCSEAKEQKHLQSSFCSEAKGQKHLQSGFCFEAKGQEHLQSGFCSVLKVLFQRTKWYCQSPITPIFPMKFFCNLLLIRYLNVIGHTASTFHQQAIFCMFYKICEDRQLYGVFNSVFPINYFLDKYRIIERYTYLC